jgi:hypothetical protein
MIMVSETHGQPTFVAAESDIIAAGVGAGSTNGLMTLLRLVQSAVIQPRFINLTLCHQFGDIIDVMINRIVDIHDRYFIFLVATLIESY